MIDYELAKQLKDAGFQGKFATNYRYDSFSTPPDDNTTNGESLYYPTLEELIEACPQLWKGMAFDLIVVEGEWIAWYEPSDQKVVSKSQTAEGLGKTPAEAVANLLLILLRGKVKDNGKREKEDN